jgi:hypothetical protein
MESLSFSFPTWYILLCALLGAVLTAVLYVRSNTLQDQPQWIRALLAGLRFLSIFLISLFLLSPLLRSTQLDTQKPTVVIAQDVSESISTEWSGEDEAGYESQLRGFENELTGDYNVDVLSFGSSTRPEFDTSFSDKVTNISNALDLIKNQYAGTNLGAVVLATDGIFNEGSNPLYASTGLAVPVYTVALGDTTPRRDLILKRAFHNRIAYLNDKFSVQLDIAARNLAGSSSLLSVYKVEQSGARKLQEQPLRITGNDFFETVEIVLDADQPGVQRFRFVLQQVNGEVSVQNNSKDIFVDVLDARQKILILADNPHPDLTAMRQSIRTNKNYEVEVAFLDDWNGNTADYDLVILHQLPGRSASVSNVLNTLDENRTPRFFILGSQTDYNRINAVQSLLGVQANPRNTNDVQGQLNPTFNLFNTQDNLGQDLLAYPPLSAAFGEFTDSGNGQVLLYQRIRKIDTQFPLLMLGNENGTKSGVLTAEGIWKWRLFDYLQNQSHEQFDVFFTKVIQYLSVKEDKRKFRVSVSANILDENEQVFFDAELYNNSYELINGPDVRMEITDDEGNTYDFTFNKTDRAYRLNAGTLPVGNYRFEASVTYNGEQFTYDGQFSVQPIQLELYETTADHGVLRLLSNRTGGRLVYPDQLQVLADSIRAEENIKPVIYQTSRTRSAINLRWLFLPILLLLVVEWGLRRYFGSY